MIARNAVLGAALALLCGAGAAWSAPTTPAKALDQLRAVAKAYQDQDCTAVQKAGAPLVDAGGLSDESLSAVYEMLVRCEYSLKQNDAAYAHVLKGTALAGASDGLWLLRFAAETYTENNEAAVATLEAIVQKRKSAIAKLELRSVQPVLFAVRKGSDKALRVRLLKVLVSPDFVFADPFVSTEFFALDLAGLLKDDGRIDEAKALVARIRNPEIILSAALDPRLEDMLPKPLDMRALFEKEIELDQKLAREHPDRLRGIVQLAGDLRRVGRDEAAMAALETARTKTGQVKQFSDMDDTLSWYWNERSHVFASLGDKDNAVASMRRGGVTQEHGGLNVSQVINLAELQVDLGLGPDAIETLEVFRASQRAVSGYGDIEMRMARVCAHKLMGELSKVAEDIAYAKAHEADNAMGVVYLLACAGEADASAAALVRLLDNPDDRTMALEQLSTYDRLGSKRDSVMDDLLAGIQKRPEVVAALARAGGLRVFNIRRRDF